MIKKLWSTIVRRFRRTQQPLPRLTVVMTTQCRDRLAGQLYGSIQRGHEGIVYFVGLTTGTTTLALAGVLPEATTTPGSVDVSATEIGKVVRLAAASGLQVVGQLHTHPEHAHHSEHADHSDGDLEGMRIRHPGYFSIVVPNYGAQVPSFLRGHALMWTLEGFREVDRPIKLYDGLET